ncbi:MAG TPA: GNAT family N-acetyltransferase [Streptosporangiaceae bacterium]|nr:GNAT family N-acetyltransferase [Streptosporangiaceae bacterium]
MPALYVVVHEAYLLYVPRIGRMPAPMTADYTAAVESGEAWVAELDGAIVGLLVLVVCPGYLLIENIAVQPSAQRRGIGSRLLMLAEDEARANGLGEIRLYTNEGMTENLAFYPRHGYRETRRAEENGFRRVFFSKVL